MGFKKHMTELHNSATAGEDVLGEWSRYQKKTWHRCGICGKEVVFTKQRLYYHIYTEHLPQKSSQFKNNPNDSTSKSLHLAPRSSNACSVPPLQPRQAKLAHTLVSVAKPKTVDCAIVKKEPVVDEILFRCPMDPCEWTCRKEGMRQGPALLHMIKAHQIQPKEMRLRGIRFHKIPVRG